MEDFVSLAETSSFSRSAQLRHITQPAFSRRIQALEAWAGVHLVERSPYPTRLTGAYLGRLVDPIAKEADVPLQLDAIHETNMGESLKAMAIEGHRLAFLPLSSVAKELQARRLVRAYSGGRHELRMESRIYRARPQAARRHKPVAMALWEFLREPGCENRRHERDPHPHAPRRLALASA